MYLEFGCPFPDEGCIHHMLEAVYQSPDKVSNLENNNSLILQLSESMTSSLE